MEKRIRNFENKLKHRSMDNINMETLGDKIIESIEEEKESKLSSKKSIKSIKSND